MLAPPASCGVVLEFARADQAGDPYAFRFVPQEYLLRTPGGGAESSRLVWDEALLAELEALRRSAGGDPVRLARLGETLRRFVVPLGWPQHEQRILEATGRGERVIVTIRSAAAELYALPWELLTCKATGQHLGELREVLIRYEWPETTTAREQPSPRPSGGRILFAWSAAAGAVPAAQHLAAIRGACQDGHHPFDTSRDVLAQASFRRLQERLAAAQRDGEPICVLHLLCHGAAAGGSFGLALDGDEVGAGLQVVDAGRLRQLLAPYAGMLRLVVLAACDSGNAGALGSQLGSLAQALHRAGLAAVVASRYPLSVEGSVRLGDSLYRSLLTGPDSLETALLAARAELAKDALRLDWASLQYYARVADGGDSRPVVFRPYRGLASFAAHDRRFYFGRQGDIARITRRLADAAHLVTVVGASGAGKSSLVLAGVVPALASSLGAEPIPVAVVRPGATPCQSLAAALLGTDGPCAAVRPVPGVAELRQALLERRETLAELLERARLTRLLVIVDQCEELFSQSERAESASFLDNLLYALGAGAGEGKRAPPLCAVLTLRADFLGLCLARPELAERVRQTMELVLPLNRAELREAILGPAALVGLRFEEGLVDALLDALRDSDSSAASLSAGNLPLLQFMLEQLWERRRGETITWEAWRALGGVRGAIARRANEILREARDAGELDLVRKLFGRLVQLGDGTVDTRRRVRRDELEAIAPGQMKPVLDRWIAARLLTADESEVTIAHEALLQEWETLRRWIDENRESLRILHLLSRDARRYHSSGRQADDLWHGTLLKKAQRLRVDGHLPLSDEEAQFLDASLAAAERQRQLVEEEAQRRLDKDVGVGARYRSMAIVGLIVLAFGGDSLIRHYVPTRSHGIYLVEAALVSAIGGIILLLLRQTLLTNQFNRQTLLLCFSAGLPISVNHWIGWAIDVPVESSTVFDLNILFTLSLSAAIVKDAALWPLPLCTALGILVATLSPALVPTIMRSISLIIVLYFIFFYRHREAQQKAERRKAELSPDASDGSPDAPVRLGW